MKLGFFTKVYDAITDFRLYPYVVQKEKWKDAFWYFFQFIFCISLILAATSMAKITNWLNEFVAEYHEHINDFEVKDGELTVNKNMNVDFLRVKIYTDDNKNLNDVDFRLLDLENYKFNILGFKDYVAIGNQKYGYICLNYKESNINTNQQGVYQMLTKALQTPSIRISFFMILFVSILTILLLTRFIYVFSISLMLMLLGLLFRIHYPWKEYWKVAFYVITLPTITQVIAFISVGELNDYAMVTYYLLCYVYMFYAVRALKLDNILTTTQEKMMNMKSEAEKAKSILEREKDSKAEEDKSIENDKIQNNKNDNQNSGNQNNDNENHHSENE